MKLQQEIHEIDDDTIQVITKVTYTKKEFRNAYAPFMAIDHRDDFVLIEGNLLTNG